MRRKKRYEYRLIWRHKGAERRHILLGQTPRVVLQRLRRIGSTEPWMGITITSLRKAWMRLALLLQVPWTAVADIPARDVVAQIKAHYPELDYIRVEWRQVGEWTQMLDPLKYLQAKTTPETDARWSAFVDTLESMPREQLDTWRKVPDAPGTEGKITTHAEYRLGRFADREQGIAAAAAAARAGRTSDDPG